MFLLLVNFDVAFAGIGPNLGFICLNRFLGLLVEKQFVICRKLAVSSYQSVNFFVFHLNFFSIFWQVLSNEVHHQSHTKYFFKLLKVIVLFNLTEICRFCLLIKLSSIDLFSIHLWHHLIRGMDLVNSGLDFNFLQLVLQCRLQMWLLYHV